MEEAKSTFKTQTIIASSISLQSTQTVEEKPGWKVVPDEEIKITLPSEELIFGIIERIKAL